MELAELLQASPAAWISVAAVFGLMIGSFLNVVIHRLPIMMEREWRQECAALDAPEGQEQEPAADGDEYNLVRPRSRCPSCNHAITALENIPLLSYAVLRGKCSECGTRISIRYPIIEFVTGLLTGIVAWHFGFTPEAGGAMVLTWALIALTMIDLDHQYLPDQITLPFLWLGLLLGLFHFYTDELATNVIGAAAGYLSLWLVFHLFRLLTGKEGMGYGDFKLLALLGAWFGWQALPVVVILSSLVGAVVGVTLIVFRGHDRSVPIPFGPYLAAAGWITMLWGDRISGVYLNWAFGA